MTDEIQYCEPADNVKAVLHGLPLGVLGIIEFSRYFFCKAVVRRLGAECFELDLTGVDPVGVPEGETFTVAGMLGDTIWLSSTHRLRLESFKLGELQVTFWSEG